MHNFSLAKPFSSLPINYVCWGNAYNAWQQKWVGLSPLCSMVFLSSRSVNNFLMTGPKVRKNVLWLIWISLILASWLKTIHVNFFSLYPHFLLAVYIKEGKTVAQRRLGTHPKEHSKLVSGQRQELRSIDSEFMARSSRATKVNSLSQVPGCSHTSFLVQW